MIKYGPWGNFLESNVLVVAVSAVSLQVTALIPAFFAEPSFASAVSNFTSSRRFISPHNDFQPIFNYSEDQAPGIPIPASEPEPDNGEGQSEAEKWPEPGPRWDKAYDKWGAAWEIHIYGFSTCFFFIFAYASYYIVVNIADGLRKKYLSVSLNAMMAVCGFTRSLVLALDPYHQGKEVDTPLKLMRIFWSLTDPCLTAADSLVILSLLETYKLSIAPQRLQRPSTIFPIITVHFGLVLISDLVVSEFLEAKAMLVFCQVFFITWCGTLGICYFLIAYKLDKLIFKRNAAEISQEGRWYIYLIYTSGLSNLVTSAVYIYSATGVFGVYSDVTFVDAWPWFSLQTALRITELFAAVLVFTVSAKRAQPAREMKPSHVSEQPLSGSATFDVGTSTASPAYTKEKKRKFRMFTALRSHRTDNYLSEQDRSSILERGAQEFPGVKYDQNLSDGEHQTPPQEKQLVRKESMFTALGHRAQQAESRGVEYDQNLSDGENQTSPQEKQLVRKESMFTALGHRAQQAESRKT